MTLTNRMLTTIAALCVFCAAPLYAQVDPGVQFTTSFPFYVGNKLLPAGTYLVTQPDPATEVLLIAGRDVTGSAVVGFDPTESLNPAVEGKVFFNQYGNRDFLSKFTINGDVSGAEFQPGKKERQAADAEHQLASIRAVASRSPSGI